MSDIANNPFVIVDSVPFIVAMEEESNRTQYSWDIDEVFTWAVYEHKPLDLT